MGGIDLTGNTAPLAPQATYAISMTPEGPGFGGASGTGGLIGVAGPAMYNWVGTTNAFSVYFRGLLPTTYTVESVIFKLTNAPTNTSPFQIIVLTSSPSTPFTRFESAGPSGGFTSGLTAVASTPSMHSVFSPLVISASNLCYCALDSVPGTSSAFGTTPPTYTTPWLGLNTSPVSLSTATLWVATCYYCWNRALTPSENIALDTDPYGFLYNAGAKDILVR
jgi:hypothetical protein